MLWTTALPKTITFSHSGSCHGQINYIFTLFSFFSRRQLMWNLSPSQYSVCSFAGGGASLWRCSGLTTPRCLTNLVFMIVKIMMIMTMILMKIFWSDHDADPHHHHVHSYQGYQPTLALSGHGSCRWLSQCCSSLTALNPQWAGSKEREVIFIWKPSNKGDCDNFACHWLCWVPCRQILNNLIMCNVLMGIIATSPHF